MSFVAGKDGETWVLDQVNARVERFGPDGRFTRELRLDGDTAQELAVGPDGKLYVLDRLARREVAIYDSDGNPLRRVPIAGEGGAVTGMFVDASGLWLEREHTDTVRIAGADGTPDTSHPTAPGRPSRDGTTTLRAALVARGGPEVNLYAGDRWRRTLTLPHAILYLLLLDSDRRGHVFLGARVGDESPEPPFAIRNQATIVLRLDLATGADAGALTLPAYTGPDEMFRELAVTDDGAVVQMLPSADGVTISTYRFP